MPYIPPEHEKYDLLPFSRENGGEVFEYPSRLLYKLEEYIKPEDQLDPYGFMSYSEYEAEIDRVALRFADRPEVTALFTHFKNEMREINRKEQWSVLRYVGPVDDRIGSLTPGRVYYWPTSITNPVYAGVIDDEEYTAYLYPTDSGLWEILEDPTGMAYDGVYEGPTKTNEVRAVKIAPQTLEVLKQWKAEYERLKDLNGDRWGNAPYVFVRDDGKRMHPDSITDWLNRFSDRHGLPHIHPHAFRHTAASTMIANGVDLVTTAAELGHANATTTAMIYAHQIAVARATAADVRAGVFANRK